MNEIIIIVCMGSVLCSLGILWINIKLYTEFMKIMNFNTKKPKDVVKP